MQPKTRSTQRWVIPGCGCIGLSLIAVCSLVLFALIRSRTVMHGPTERGVLISALEPSGYRQTPLPPGRSFVWPFAEHAVLYPIDKKTYSTSSTQDSCCDPIEIKAAEFLSSDGIVLFVDFRVDYALNPDEVVKVHLAWNDRFQSDFVQPISKTITQEIGSRYTSEEIALTRRGEIGQEIRSRLADIFSENGFILLDYQIEDANVKVR
jgi:regulator of protease activity HflC (stomatin/prohibitin superfamily)